MISMHSVSDTRCTVQLIDALSAPFVCPFNVRDLKMPFFRGQCHVRSLLHSMTSTHRITAYPSIFVHISSLPLPPIPAWPQPTGLIGYSMRPLPSLTDIYGNPWQCGQLSLSVTKKPWVAGGQEKDMYIEPVARSALR